MSNRMTPQPIHRIRLFAAVGIGGMLGAIGRYGISTFLGTYNGFPYATLTANIMGCFLLSFLMNQRKLKQKLSPEIFIGLSTGMIGAFTTFSTFAIETVDLFYNHAMLAICYVFISVIGGLLSCYIGFRFAVRRQGV